MYFDRNATMSDAKRRGEQPVVEPAGAPRSARRPADKAREGGIPGVFRPKRNDERREATRFSRDGSPAEPPPGELGREGFTTGCLARMDRRPNATWISPPAANANPPPGLPFPAYRHRPGRTPHPERDPAGHRFLERLPRGLLPAPPIPLAALPETPLFRYGEQLFRAGFWWEAHAVWEELWRAADREGAGETPEREVLRAFIQLAAAALKNDLGAVRGSRKLLSAARSRMVRASDCGDTGLFRPRFEALRAAAGLAAGGRSDVSAGC